MIEIPLSPIPAQTFNVVLSGRYCTISLYWRQERLYLDLVTANGGPPAAALSASGRPRAAGGVVICRGAICQNRADVVQSRSPDFAGSLHFADLEGDRPPHWQKLNERWILLYVEEGEELPEKLRC